MAMDQLPEELVAKILLLLDPQDRLSCALTCRRWAEAVNSPSMLEDIYLVFWGSEMEKLTPALMESRRPYRQLRVFGADLTRFDSNLWNKVGEHLEGVWFSRSVLEPQVLDSILQSCPQLEWLELSGYTDDHMYFKKLRKRPACKHPSTVLKPMRNMRDVTLGFAPSPEFLDHLLGLMPDLTSLAIFDDFARRRFDEVFNEPDPADNLAHDRPDADSDDDPVGSSADRPRWMPCILKASHKFTRLHLLSEALSDADFIELMRRFSGSLTVLAVNCSSLTERGYSRLSDCRSLESLTLHLAEDFENRHMAELVFNNPDLEALDLVCCYSLTDEGFAHIHHLRKLQQLSVFYCIHVTGNALSNLGKIPTLDHLALKQISADDTVFRGLVNLKNLKTLRWFGGMTSESFDIICTNFEKLEELSLADGWGLSDDNGVKLNRLKHLEILEIRGIGFTDRTFEEGLVSRKVELLELHSCTLTDGGLASIAARHGRLRGLCLYYCDSITNAGLLALLHREPILELLELRACDALTDEFLEALHGNVCPRLENIVLSQCPFSVQAVKAFKSKRPLVYVKYSSGYVYVGVRRILRGARLLHSAASAMYGWAYERLTAMLRFASRPRP